MEREYEDCRKIVLCVVVFLSILAALVFANLYNEIVTGKESVCKETETELVFEKLDKEGKLYSLQRQEAADLCEIISEQDVQIMNVTESSVTYVKDENSKVFNLKYNAIDLRYGGGTKPKVRITIDDTSKYVSVDAYLPGSVTVYKSHE